MKDFSYKRRISASRLIATKFKFDPININVQNDYLACDFESLQGNLKESEESLHQAKLDFTKWLISKGILPGRGNAQSLSGKINWEVASDGNYLVLGVPFKQFNLTKETIEERLKKKNLSYSDREKEYEDYENEQNAVKNLSVDEYRKQHGKEIIQDILSQWN